MQLMKKFLSLSLVDLALFLETCLYLTFASFVKTFLPFRWYAFLLGRQTEPDLNAMNSSWEKEFLLPYQRAILRGSKYLPFECKCLVQAIAGRMLLFFRGYDCRLYLGVFKKDDQLKAHAWLNCDGDVLVGRGGVQVCKVISMFDSTR